MRLGVDIDDTIKYTHKAALLVYNRELKQNIKSEDVCNFYLDEAFGITKEDGRLMWRQVEEEIYREGQPFPDAANILNDLLTDGHIIEFITARPDDENIVKVTEEWLEKHGFPYNGDNLIAGAYQKGVIAKEKNIDLFFEDAPHHLDNLIKHNIRVVVMDAPYNRGSYEDCFRVNSWLEAQNVISIVENQLNT